MIRVSMVAACLLTLAASIRAQDFQVLAGPDAKAGRAMMHEYLMTKVREAMDRRDAAYEVLKTREDLAAYQQRMRQFFVDALGGFPDRTPLNPRVVATEDRDGYRVEKVIFESQPRHFVTAVLYLPDRKPPYPGVLVPCGHGGNGKASEAYQRASILQAQRRKQLWKQIDQGHLVLAVDLRGLGETAPDGSSKRGIAHHVGQQWKDFYLAYLLGTSYLAMRTEDILASARFLAGYEAGDKPNRVHLKSIGRAGPPALHAAALEPELFASVSLRNCLESWSSVLRTPMATNQFENVVHGALKAYDLPDLLATLPKEKVTVTEPLGPTQQPVEVTD